jgi:ABC-type amino acid transport substrate-binding protein
MKGFGFFLILSVIVFTVVYSILYPSSSEFAEADVYDEIMGRGIIKVGINTNSKPFGFVDKDGNLCGYDVDLAHYIAQYLVRNRDGVKFIPVTPANRLTKIATGDVDLVISTVTITPQRQEIIGFSIPYDTAGQAVLINQDSKITSITDLAGQNIGVIFGTTAEKNIKNIVPTASIFGFKSYPEAYLALKQKKINAITSDDVILSHFAKEDSNVKLLSKRYSIEPYGIAFKKGNSTIKLKENLDFAIQDMQQKNVIQRLHKKWGI